MTQCKILKVVATGFFLAPVCVQAQSIPYTWTETASGDWDTTTYWTPTGYPHMQGDTATIDLTSAQTITVNTTGIDVGAITIGGSAVCTITGTSTDYLTFLPTSGSASIAVSGSAANTISSPLHLSAPLTVSNSSSGTLTLSGQITASGSDMLTYSGSAMSNTLDLTDASNSSSFTSGLNITGGTVTVSNVDALGSGTITLSGSGVLEIDQGGAMLAPAINCNGTGVLYSEGGLVTLKSAIKGNGNLIFCANDTSRYFILTQPSTFSGTVTMGYGDTLGDGYGGVSISAVDQLGSGLTGINAMTDAHQSEFYVTASGLTIDVPLTVTGTGDLFIFVPTGDIFTYSGNISSIDEGGLRCTAASSTPGGGGTLVLSGDNTGLVGGFILSGTDATLYPTLSVGSAENIGSTTIKPPSESYSIRIESYAGVNFTGNVVCTPTMNFGVHGTAVFTLGDGTVSSISGTVQSDAADQPIILDISGPGALYFTGNSSSTWTETLGATMSSGATLGVSSNDSFGPDSSVNTITLNDGYFQILGSAYGGTGIASVNRPLDLTGPGGLLLDDGTTSSWGGGLVGSQDLTIQQSPGMTGTGIIALTGDSATSYTGEITIDTVTVQISNDNNLGSDAALTIDEGTLEFTASVTSPRQIVLEGSCTLLADSGTDNVLSGSLVNGTSTGLLIKGNPGIVELTAVNSYSGSTSIEGGTLSLGGVGSIASSSSVTLVNSGTAFNISALSAGAKINNLNSAAGSTINLGANTLTVDQTASGIVDGVIEGSGGLTLEGSGSLSLEATNSYTGNTLVSSGSLYVDGSIASSPLTTVSSGALLGGTGILNDITLYGTIAPGNSIGTLTANNVIFESGSTYDVELLGSQSDLIDAATIAILPGSTLYVEPMALTNEVFVIAATSSPSGVTGTFSTVTSSLPRYRFTAVYLPDEVILELSMTDFAEYFKKGNLRNLAICFDEMIENNLTDTPIGLALQLSTNPAQNSILDVLNLLSVSGIIDAFNQFDPAPLGSINIAELDSALSLLELYCNHMYQYRCSPCVCHRGVSIWAAPFGIDDKRNRSDYLKAYSGFRNRGYGLVTGADYAWNSRLNLSLGFSYARNRMKWSEANVRARYQSYSGIASGSYAADCLFLNATFAGTYNNVSAARKIYVASPVPGIPPIDYTIRNHNNSYSAASSLSCAYSLFSWGGCLNFSIWPYANCDYLFLHQYKYNETGGELLDLTMHARNTDLLLPETGLLFRLFGQSCDVLAYADIWLGYSPQIRLQGQRMIANFRDLPSCRIPLTGLFPEKSFFTPRVDFGIEKITNNLKLFFSYLGYYSSSSHIHQISIETRYQF